MKKSSFKTFEEYYKKSLRYYKNALQKLKEAKVEYNRYQDLKPVREACGTAYLSVLLALDGYLLQRGLNKEKLPTSFDAYQENLRRYLVHNGKIRNALANVYEILHIWGYYRGIGDPEVVKEGFEKAKIIINVLGGNKL